VSSPAGDIKPDLVRQYLDAAQLSAHEANRVALRHAREGFARHAHDTGGAEAQIAALTERIRYMTAHLSTHHKDNASRRGLIAMLERRKKLLKYLRRRDGDSYGEVIYRLGLKDRSFVEDKYPKTSARK
jgi:ribosomal protein S15